MLGPCALRDDTAGAYSLPAPLLSRMPVRPTLPLGRAARRVDPSLNNAVLIDMARGAAGVTLIESSFTPSASLPQFVCLVIDGPPAPPVGSEPSLSH
jgi:hypothetical protein